MGSYACVGCFLEVMAWRGCSFSSVTSPHIVPGHNASRKQSNSSSNIRMPNLRHNPALQQVNTEADAGDVLGSGQVPQYGSLAVDPTLEAASICLEVVLHGQLFYGELFQMKS